MSLKETTTQIVDQIMAHLKHEEVTLREFVTFICEEQRTASEFREEVISWLEFRSLEGIGSSR